jgi:hypothetical protein
VNSNQDVETIHNALQFSRSRWEDCAKINPGAAAHSIVNLSCLFDWLQPWFIHKLGPAVFGHGIIMEAVAASFKKNCLGKLFA